MQCTNCKVETNNPSFCSKSCSAKYNNKLYPKRKPEGICSRCSGPVSKERTYCKKCWVELLEEKSVDRYLIVTLAEMRGLGSANFGGKYPYLRTLSRKTYMKSGKPMECYVCGYSYHVDVAHIRDLRDFPPDTKVAEANALSNLVALCRNHHYEFDTGHLKIEF